MQGHETGQHRLGVSSGTGWTADQGCEMLQCQAESCQLSIKYTFPTQS